MVTPNIQLLIADTHVSHHSLVTPNSQLLADTHVSHRLVQPLQIFSYWLIHMSAIAWLLQIFS